MGPFYHHQWRNNSFLTSKQTSLVSEKKWAKGAGFILMGQTKH